MKPGKLLIFGPVVVLALASGLRPAASDCTGCPTEWIGPGGVAIDGRPGTFHHGAGPGTFIWHDLAGWHLRNTDPPSTGRHMYSGTITAVDGRLTNVQSFGFEADDHLSLMADNVLTFRFATYQAVDGIDFHASGQAISFSLTLNGATQSATQILIGKSSQHPPSNPFTVRRVVVIPVASSTPTAVPTPAPTPVTSIAAPTPSPIAASMPSAIATPTPTPPSATPTPIPPTATPTPTPPTATATPAAPEVTVTPSQAPTVAELAATGGGSSASFWAIVMLVAGLAAIGLGGLLAIRRRI